jgi:hypothetical protein
VKFWKWFFILLGPLLLGLFIGVMVMVIYPNSLKLAGFLCPDDKPDAFVVRYTVSTSDGTGTNWTLYCMSERGETEEIGTWLPLLVVCGVAVATVYAFAFVLLIRRMIRGIGGDPTPAELTPEVVLAQRGESFDPFAKPPDPVEPPPG